MASVATTTAVEPGVIVITQTASVVSDKDSPTIGAGKATLRIKDFDPEFPFGVTLRAPRKIGPETKLDLRVPMSRDLCALEDEKGLFVVKGDSAPLEGDFVSIAFTQADGKPLATFRQFENGECDKVSVVSKSVNSELQFSIKLTRVECSEAGSAPVAQCPGERPLSDADQKMMTPEGDCEQIVSILCLWHLIVIGVGGCCCLLICILLIVCLATRGGDDDDSSEEEGDKLEVVMWKRSLEGGSTINSKFGPDSAREDSGIAATAVTQVDNEQRATVYDTDIAQQQQQPAQTGIYASMPNNDTQSQGDAFAYGDLAVKPDLMPDQWVGDQQAMQDQQDLLQQQQEQQQWDQQQQQEAWAGGDERPVASYVQQW
jgi:hypothetical protein